MKVIEILSELRRNPESNPRIAGDAAVAQYLQGLSADELKHTGISMTNLPKLGINPGSGYDTPLGVYFYPAEYWLQQHQRQRKLPFQHNAPYIQLLSFSGAVLDLGDIEQSDYDEIIDRLRPIAERWGVSSEKIDQLRDEASNSANVGSLAGHLWYVMYRVVQYSGAKRSMAWNTLIRQLGYNAVVDPGQGIIHPSEKAQGFVANPRDMRHLATYDNPARVQNRRDNPEVGAALSARNQPGFIDKAIAALWNADNIVLGSPGMKKLAPLLLQAFRANPTEWPKIAGSLTLVSNLTKLLPSDDQFEVWGQWVVHRWPQVREDIQYDVNVFQAKLKRYMDAGLDNVYIDTSTLKLTIERWRGYVAMSTQTPEVLAVKDQLAQMVQQVEEIDTTLEKYQGRNHDQLLKQLGL